MSIAQLPWTQQPQQHTPAAVGDLMRGAYIWSPHNPLELYGERTIQALIERSLNDAPTGDEGVARRWSRVADAGIDFGASQLISQNNGVTVLVVAAPVASANMKVPFSQRIGSGSYTQTDFVFNAATIDSLGASAGNLALTTYHAGSGGVMAAGQVDGKTHCWVAGNGPLNGFIFRDGVKQALTTSIRTSTFTSLLQKLRIGNIADNTTTTYPCDDPVFLVVIWDRLLSEEDAQAVSANPWQVFNPLPRRIFELLVAAGGGATTTVYSDNTASYLIKNSISADIAQSYAVRSASSADRNAAYNVRSAGFKDSTTAYAIRNAISADRSADFFIRSATQKDIASIFNLRKAVNSDSSASYDIQSASSVASGLTASYSVHGAVHADKEVLFSVRNAVNGYCSASYTVRLAEHKDLGASYSISDSVSSVASDFSAEYGVDNAALAYPSASEIAVAVIDALNATTGARTVGQHLQIQTAVLAGETSGAGTSHIKFTDGGVIVEADVHASGHGDRMNVAIGGV